MNSNERLVEQVSNRSSDKSSDKPFEINPDWFEKELTRDFGPIGEPDIWFKFRTTQNMSWEEDSKYTSDMRRLRNGMEGDDEGIIDIQMRKVILDWNVPHVETGERLPIPSDVSGSVSAEDRPGHRRGRCHGR